MTEVRGQFLDRGDSDQVERPTLKTIAVQTGLAVATVSRALKDAPDIGEDTKRRVRETAERLGYRPNRAGVRLRTGKTNVIALALTAEPNVLNYTGQLLYAIASGLRGTAYHLVVMPYFTDQDPMDPIRYLVETESADAIIMNQTQPQDPRVKYLIDRGFPFATHGRTYLPGQTNFVDYDNEACVRLALHELNRRGRRHVLVVAPPRNHTYARHTIEGAQRAGAALGIEVEVMDDLTSDEAPAQIEAAVARRLGRDRRPDAIYSASTYGAMAACAGAERLGLVLARDFDVAAKEAVPLLHRFRRDMIVVRENVDWAGRTLARVVMDCIEGRLPVQGLLEVPSAVEPAPKG